MTIDFENERAFAPLAEPVKWTSDAAPRRAGTFRAVVTRGAVDSSAAGPALGPIVGDVWSVHASRRVALCASIKVGDTVERVGIGAERLTVQRIIAGDSGWWLLCTADERAPR